MSDTANVKYVLTEILAAAPSLGVPVVVLLDNGKRYRVASVRRMWDDSSVVIALEEWPEEATGRLTDEAMLPKERK